MKKIEEQDYSLWQWRQWLDEGFNVLPYITAYPLRTGAWSGEGMLDWRGVWADANPNSFILESGKDGRYTFVGIHPESRMRSKGNVVTVEDQDGHVEQWEEAPLEALKRWMAPYRAPRLAGTPKFTGGCVGYLSYDVARSIEKLPNLAEDDLELPDLVFLRVHELWVIDHEQQCVYCCVMSNPADANLERLHLQAKARVASMHERWTKWVQAGVSQEANQLRQERQQLLTEGMAIDIEAFEGVSTAFPKEQFKEAVRRIQSYIGAGDVFQVNLSMRQMKEMKESAEQLYEWLRIVNPSPYMGLLRFPEFQVISCSPELLVKLERGEVSARPIAGTRRRGKSVAEDEQMAEELRTNEKERAEHIMLVDLERNDLGRISAYGSVHVDELMAIEYYSHVMHLVSNVRGKLADDKDAYDVIRAKFPGGTITGAPKIRTMEIIEELEPVRRGTYTGSMGWIDYTGDMELNIIIRTLVLKEGIGHIQAGAGIVIDSDPEREYRESLNKAKALWKAVQLSEREWRDRIQQG